MTCRIESNATFQASQESEEWGYRGGNIKCPFKSTCKGEENCHWENFRTINLVKKPAQPEPTRTQKFFTKLEHSVSMINERKLRSA